jgi:hypothetical protein
LEWRIVFKSEGLRSSIFVPPIFGIKATTAPLDPFDGELRLVPREYFFIVSVGISCIYSPF